MPRVARSAGRTLATLGLLLLVPAALAAAYVWYTWPAPVQDVVVPPPPADPVAAFMAEVEEGRPEDDDRALESLARQLAKAREQFGAEHEQVAEAGMRLADLLRQLGRLPEARAAYKNVVAVRQQLHGPEHWQVREARARLAELDQQDARVREADRLHRQAERLGREGKYLQAITVCQQALDQRKAIHGEAHADVADSLALLGMLSYNHGDHYRSAEAILRQALDLLGQTRGPDHPAYANCLHWLAALADDRGDFDGATKLYEQALATHSRARGERTPEYARTLNRYGRLGITWAKDYAHGRCFRALQIRQQVLGPDHLDCAESLEDLALIALRLFDFNKAEQLLREALAIRQWRQGERHPDLAETWSWLAVVLAEKGDLAQAHVCHRKAILLTEEARGREHPLLARYLSNFAELTRLYWDFKRSERMYQQALAIRQEAGVDRHPDQAGDFTSRTESLCYDASLILGPDELPVESFAKDFERAIACFESIPGGTRLPRYPEALCWLAEEYYWDNYRYRSRADAEALCRKALPLFYQDGGTLHPYYPDYLIAMGRIHASRGEYDRAEVFFRDYVELIKGRYGAVHPEKAAEPLSTLAGMHLHQGTNSGEVIARTREILDLEEKLFLQNAVGQSDRIRIASLCRRYHAISFLLSAGIQADALPGLYRDVLSFRGAATAYQKTDRVAHDRPELHDLLDRVEQARRQLTRLAFHPPTRAADQPAWQMAVDAASDAKEDLENELALELRRFIAPEPPLEVKDLQAVLPRGAVLIDFLNYIHYQGPPDHQGRNLLERRLVAFLLHRDAGPVCVPLGRAADIERAVFAWRQALLEERDPARLEAATQEVARLVWQPLAPHLGQPDTLIIAPDGPVCFLSFAALPGNAPGSYLLEDYRIGYVPSGRAAYDLFRQDAAPAGQGMLALGGIRYDTSGPASPRPASAPRRRGSLSDTGSWPDLPGSETEARRVLRLSQQALREREPQLIAGADAGPRAFLEALQGKWRYIHFAGHGFFADPGTTPGLSRRATDQPAERYVMTEAERQVFSRNQLLLSGLVLAPRAGLSGQDENILTAEELGGVDLRGTELVTLSACETGLGSTAGGEGVLGLQRAFLMAGARGVLASLWRVDDAATVVLMQEFYSNLWQEPKLPAWEALRQAQLTVLRHPELVAQCQRDLVSRGVTPGKVVRPAEQSGRSHPAAWAAFVLSGDGR